MDNIQQMISRQYKLRRQWFQATHNKDLQAMERILAEWKLLKKLLEEKTEGATKDTGK